MKRKLRYGLIGCGGCGVNKHLASYAKFPDEVELVGVFDADPVKARSAAERFKVPRVYESYEALLAAPDIDVVSVVTPNALHAPIAIAALRAGKHVHVEKPIALNAQEARAIVAAKNKARRKVLVALNNRFTESAQCAKRYVQEGRLGEIYHARCGWRRRQGYDMAGRWFADKAQSGGGPMIDLGVHFFDLTMYLMGYPAAVTVTGCCYDKIARPPAADREFPSVMLGGSAGKGRYDVEDMAVGFARLRTGASVAFEFNWASHIEREMTYLELMGTRGGLSLIDGVLKIYTQAAGELVDVVPQVRNIGAWGENETRHFLHCLRTGAAPLAPPEEAVTMMAIIDAFYASARTGREVAVRAGR